MHLQENRYAQFYGVLCLTMAPGAVYRKGMVIRMKAKDVVAQIVKHYGVNIELPSTCDGYKAGDPETEVTGVVTSFMATANVIREAARLGANMIITHEPTYFTGNDKTDWCTNDAVYLAKKKLIDETGMVIWRNHDLIHMTQPDGIYDGFIKEMGWEQYALPPVEKQFGGEGGMQGFIKGFSDYYDLPKTTLGQLAQEFKQKLQMDTVRVIGDTAMPCSRVGVLVGGGSLGFGIEELPMQIMEEKGIDVLVCGEITEWTTCAYIGDAVQLGLPRAMIVLGHERTEEWGMKHMRPWLEGLLSVPVWFVDAKEPFSYL